MLTNVAHISGISRFFVVVVVVVSGEVLGWKTVFSEKIPRRPYWLPMPGVHCFVLIPSQ
jgi:hypothetical protein